MGTAITVNAPEQPRRRPRPPRVLAPGGRSGQTVVEIALVGMAFLTIILGTIDLGRAMYQYHQLTSAVRDGARFGKLEPPNEAGIKDAVLRSADTLGLSAQDVTRSCTGGCYQGCADVTVAASKEFSPILTRLLGFDEAFSITLSSSATADAG